MKRLLFVVITSIMAVSCAKDNDDNGVIKLFVNEDLGYCTLECWRDNTERVSKTAFYADIEKLSGFQQWRDGHEERTPADYVAACFDTAVWDVIKQPTTMIGSKKELKNSLGQITVYINEQYFNILTGMIYKIISTDNENGYRYYNGYRLNIDFKSIKDYEVSLLWPPNP